MKKFSRTILAAAVFGLGTTAALADITIGVSLPLTGPASGLGIPMANQIKLWPKTIAGEKVNVVVLDDATDPTKGVNNAKRFVTGLLRYLDDRSPATLAAIRDSGDLSDETEGQVKAAIASFAATFVPSSAGDAAEESVQPDKGWERMSSAGEGTSGN